MAHVKSQNNHVFRSLTRIHSCGAAEARVKLQQKHRGRYVDTYSHDAAVAHVKSQQKHVIMAHTWMHSRGAAVAHVKSQHEHATSAQTCIHTQATAV